jgi:hypothetical protein
MAGSVRTFAGQSYRSVQQANRLRRDSLPKADRRALQQQGFRNVGWDNVIRLSQQLDQLLAPPELTEELTEEESIDADLPSLDALFLEADRIGNSYQSAEEIAAFNQQLAEAVNAVDAEIDRLFPDDQVEVVHFQPVRNARRSAKSRSKPRR